LMLGLIENLLKFLLIKPELTNIASHRARLSRGNSSPKDATATANRSARLGIPIALKPSIASGASRPVELKKNCKSPPFQISERESGRQTESATHEKLYGATRQTLLGCRCSRARRAVQRSSRTTPVVATSRLLLGPRTFRVA
jgi:hypothetical protein